jgi:hypothetical protein
MNFDLIVSSLAGVRKTGPSTVMARCPAHADKSPSLSVRRKPDGLVLMHCFAGCSVDSVVGAIGLDLETLMPPKSKEPGAGHSPERRPWLPSDVFSIVRREAGILVLIGCDMHAKRSVSDTDHARLLQAVNTLDRIAEAAYARA